MQSTNTRLDAKYYSHPYQRQTSAVKHHWQHYSVKVAQLLTSTLVAPSTRFT